MPRLLDRNAGRPARLLQWNIGLQREIGRNLVVEASYVANRGVWWGERQSCWNSAHGRPGAVEHHRPGYAARLGFNDFTSATEAQLLTTTVAA